MTTRKLTAIRRAFNSVFFNHRLNKIWHKESCNVRVMDDRRRPIRCECGFTELEIAIDKALPAKGERGRT